ncbi:MAG TPA: cytochrome c [Kofleriaceae bacterium]|jgi:cytochrome c
MRKLTVLLVALAACHHSSSPAAPASSDPTVALNAQVEQGKGLYVAKCASCHGDAGQGTDKGPPVVGADAFPLDPRPGAKRDVKFHTAADVFAWATKNMPGDNPASLTTDEYLAIFAFDLNGEQDRAEGAARRSRRASDRASPLEAG